MPIYPRSIMVPKVWQSHDPEMVEIRTVIDEPNVYYESRLTPEEAETLAWELWTDARRARSRGEANKRLAKYASFQAPETPPHTADTSDAA